MTTFWYVLAGVSLCLPSILRAARSEAQAAQALARRTRELRIAVLEAEVLDLPFLDELTEQEDPQHP